MSQEKNEPINLDLDFAPSWARQSPEEALKRYARDTHAGDSGRRENRGKRGDWNDRGARRDRPRRDERRGGVEKIGRRTRDERSGPPAPAGMPPPPIAPREERPLRAPEAASAPRDYRDRGPQPEPLPFELRLLPEQKALGTIIRRIQTSHRAYPLRDLANLFLDNPASCLVRIELHKDQPAEARVYQCKVCGLPALSDEEMTAHILAEHLEHFFDVADVEGESPSGNFTCVARCGLSGTILGPPNHHSYATKVQEMLRTRYPNLSVEAYHARIEMIREPEAIEEWREQAKKRRIYRLKQAPVSEKPAAERVPPTGTPAEAPADTTAEVTPTEPAEVVASPGMERDVAERLLQREIVQGQFTAARSLVATVDIVRKTPSPKIAYALREALYRENKFPASLFFALRGAFRHRKLCLFKANDPRGPDFVVVNLPVALDVSHTTEELRTMLGFVTDHPGVTRTELFEAVAAGDEAKQQATATSLNWLVERGHLIEYYNGVLCVPMEYPKFRYLQSERPGGGGREPARRRDDAPRQAPPPKAAPAAAAAPKPEKNTPQPAPAEVAAPKAKATADVTPEAVATEAPAPEAKAAEAPAPEAKATEAPAPEAKATEAPAPEAPPQTETVAEPVSEAAPQAEVTAQPKPEPEPAANDTPPAV